VVIHIGKVLLKELANKPAALAGRDGFTKTPCNLCGQADKDLSGHGGEY
jgi:hypothetical protein